MTCCLKVLSVGAVDFLNIMSLRGTDIKHFVIAGDYKHTVPHLAPSKPTGTAVMLMERVDVTNVATVELLTPLLSPPTTAVSLAAKSVLATSTNAGA